MDSEFLKEVGRIAGQYGDRVPIKLWRLFVEAIDEPEYPFAGEYVRNGIYRAAVPISGGLDSTIAYTLARQKYSEDEVFAVYFNFGQGYMREELAALGELEIFPWIQEFELSSSQWQHIIPGRNLIILLAAANAVIANGAVYFGATKGEIPPFGGDKSQLFLNKLREYVFPKSVVDLGDRTKSGWVRWWIENDFERSQLLKTFSCFSPVNGKQCGTCQSCLRDYIAFANNGYSKEEILVGRYDKDPTVHSVAALQKYKAVMKKELLAPGSTTYGEERAIETLSVIAPNSLAKIGKPVWRDYAKNEYVSLRSYHV